MERDKVKELMVESLKLAQDCKKEAQVYSATADGIMLAIVAVKIFDALSSEK